MIFVTVGTHEQQFDRLIKAVDRLVEERDLDEPVFMQTGYCTYVPKCCEWARFVPALEMRSHMEKADIVVTHGGPSSFIEAIAAGKCPVVVPRRLEFGEHINDHQVSFVHKVAERNNAIVPVYEIDQLSNSIKRARKLSINNAGYMSHNEIFCNKLMDMIENL